MLASRLLPRVGPCHPQEACPVSAPRKKMPCLKGLNQSFVGKVAALVLGRVLEQLGA